MVRDTSIQVYKDIISERVVSQNQTRVLSVISNNTGITDREIAVKLGYEDPNMVRPRRKELLDMGVIIDYGKRACKVSGRVVYQWRLNELFRLTEKPNQESCPNCNGSGKIARY